MEFGAVRFAGTDRYSVVRLLGQGASGDVYEVQDEQAGRRVALKLLREVTPDRLLRFKEEFRQVADLSHPNLVTLYDLEVSEGRWFFTMELIDGVDFIRHVRPAGLDEGRLRDALAQLIEALGALHRFGTVHRDVKPSNVLVDSTGRVVVLDFGLAATRAVESADTLSMVELAGTPAYMSPEQANGAPATPESDWYAVGTLLYQALTGELPFSGSVLKVLLDKRVRSAPPLASEAASEDLIAVTQGLLARDATARPRFDSLAERFSVEPRGASGPVSAAAFVGRVDELSVLRRLFQGCNGLEVAHVTGTSGVGKSALVERFARSCPPATVILRGRCFEREALPFKALDQLCDSLARVLRRLSPDEAAALLPRNVSGLVELFPVLGRVPAIAGAPRRRLSGSRSEERIRAFSALRELLYRLADRRRLILLLEDLQWGDPDSADLLEHILTDADAPPLLIVATYRSDEASRSEFVRRFREAHGATIVELKPLPDTEARVLLNELLPGSIDGKLAEVLSESRGHPLFIWELARHVAAVRRGAAEEGTELSFVAVLTARVGRVTGRAKRLLETIVACDGPVPPRVACAAAQVSIGALEELRAADLVRVLPDGEAEIFHDMIRERLRAAEFAGPAADMNAALAQAFLDVEPPEVERAALHLEAAGESGRASSYLVEAAERAQAGLAFSHAASLYGRALALGAKSGSDGRVLQVHRADCWSLAGRTREAGMAYLSAAESQSRDSALRLQLVGLSELLFGGHGQEGESVMADVLRSVGLPQPRSRYHSAFLLVSAQLKLALTRRPRDLLDR
ncbi:MAG: protein kinase, partial [Proteobacteria bacterium]|nr:protein kinase [Pseudomonadota bacterium]